jgi:short-subunit dehydrogenase
MNPRIGSWYGRRVWVIGASAGIGRALGRLLADRGADVAFTARDARRLAEAVGGRPRATIRCADVTDPASLRAARDSLLAQWGGIDLVCVVAGSYVPMRADSFDLAAAHDLVRVNLGGALNCLDAVLPVLVAQGSGGVALVASAAGYGGLPRGLAYGPTKAALINLSEALYLDLRPRGVAVYQVNPGFVRTGLTSANPRPVPALIEADQAALRIVEGLERGRFHIHFPRRYTNVLRMLRLLPYGLYFAIVRKVAGG